jgi:hypothetical protein
MSCYCARCYRLLADSYVACNPLPQWAQQLVKKPGIKVTTDTSGIICTCEY